MVRGKTIFIAALVAALIIGASILLWDGEEGKIKKQFAFFSQKAAKAKGEGQLSLMAKAKAIQGLFTDPCRLEVPSHSVSADFHPDELLTLVMKFFSEFSTVRVTFHDLAIAPQDEGTANAQWTVRVVGILTDGDATQDVYEFTCALRKVKDEWRFHSLRAVDVLEK